MRYIFGIITAVIISLSYTAPVSAGPEDYTLEPSIFGLGVYTKYSGPVTSEAALKYLADGKDAIRSTLENNPSYFHVYFYLRNAKVVVVQRPGAKIHFNDLVQVLNNFRDRELWVQDIYLVTLGGKVTDMVNASRINTKGRARFMALRSVKIIKGEAR